MVIAFELFKRVHIGGNKQRQQILKLKYNKKTFINVLNRQLIITLSNLLAERERTPALAI